MSIKQKYEAVQKSKLCINCLGRNHRAMQCKSQTKCRVCQNKHNTLLHFEKPAVINTPEILTHLWDAQFVKTMLSTAQVSIEVNDKTEQARALIDQGSQATFISENLIKKLKATTTKADLQLSGVGNSNIQHINKQITIEIGTLLTNNIKLSCNACVLSKISEYQVTPEKIFLHPKLKRIQLAENYSRPGEIDILIGADLYSQVIKTGIIRINKDIVAQNTIFGWILSGRINKENSINIESLITIIEEKEYKNLPLTVTQVSTTESSLTTLENQLKKFWEIEECQNTLQELSERDKQCEQHFKETYSRDETGRFIVRLCMKPGKNEHLLGNSKIIAIKSLNRLQVKLNKNQTLITMYKEFLKECLELGHMKLITENTENIVFLPHQGVLREEKTTTKLRVVFNASCPTSTGVALNDILEIGPKLQTDITGVILRWRLHLLVMISDIEKMFRQIAVHSSDQNLQCILWHNEETKQLEEYQLTTVTYGTGPAPYLANRVVRELAILHKEKYPKAYEVLCKNIYIDDILFGAQDLDELAEIRNQVKDILQSGGLILKKCSSNNVNVLSDLKEENKVPVSDITSDNKTTKILGLPWNALRDSFDLQFAQLDAYANTKRQIASNVAQIYDPLGWLSPITIRAKLTLQQLWVQKIEWDTKVPEEIQTLWKKYVNDTQRDSSLSLKRWIGATANPYRVQLIGFCDASLRAYSSVVYIKIQEQYGPVHVSLLMAKTRVAPINTLSIPRLELCGAVLLKNLILHIKNQINLKVNDIFSFTDSQIVLAWLQKHACNWGTFVGNRVSQIQTELQEATWYHVKTKENPADLNSRGISVQELITSQLWWRGPKWLQKDTTFTEEIWNTEIEKRKTIHHCSTKYESIEFYSSWPKTIHIWAYVIRFCSKSRNRKTQAQFNALSMYEIRESKRLLLRNLQEQQFASELEYLTSKQQVTKTSRLSNLNLYLDEYGLIRVGGRLEESALQYEQKHPIILDYNKTAEIIVRQVHDENLHGRVQLTLHHLRLKFWIIKARQLVTKVVKNCIVCRRYDAKSPKQQMGNLPRERCTPSRPFTCTGVDYVGPIQVRTAPGRGHKTQKAWIAVFVCLSTKAIHLELVSSCSTSAFMSSLIRFVSRKGSPCIMFSDNGTNFQGANSTMKRAFREATRNPENINKLAMQEIEWKFIPPSAPHFGGIWEAGVKSAKTHLKKVFGSVTPTFEELTTTLCQIEACLNSRPLIIRPNENPGYEVLTPAHFLIGIKLQTPSCTTEIDPDSNYSERWKKMAQLTHKFWKLWSNEYLDYTAKKKQMEIGI